MWTTVQARAEQENRATGTETKTACPAVLPQNYNHRPGSGNGFGKRWRMPSKWVQEFERTKKVVVRVQFWVFHVQRIREDMTLVFRNRKLEVGSWKLDLVNFVHWFRKRLVDLGTAMDSWYKVD